MIDVVKGKNIQDAFPITMLEHHRNWKLTARLPNYLDGKRHFDLFINGKNFLAHYFAPMTESASNTLKGVITVNEGEFLGEDQVFQWSPHVAQSGFLDTIGEDRRI